MTFDLTEPDNQMVYTVILDGKLEHKDISLVRARQIVDEYCDQIHDTPEMAGRYFVSQDMQKWGQVVLEITVAKSYDADVEPHMITIAEVERLKL